MTLAAQLTNQPATANAAVSEEAVIVLNSKRRIQQITPRAATLLDRTPEQLIGVIFESLGTPEELGLAVREQPVYSRSRRPSAIVVTLRMVEFHTSEHDELVRPWQASVELAVLRGPDGRVLSVNEAFARKFGVPRASWPGADASTLIHPDDVAGWRGAVARIDRPPHRGSHEHRWQTAQGWRWLSWEDCAVRNADGVIIAYRSIGRDVTKRRLAEEHFQKLASAVEQSPFAIVMTTPDGRVQYVNPRYTQSTGFTLEEIFEKNIPVLRGGHVSDESFIEFQETMRLGRKWTGDLCTRRKDGAALWEHVQVSPIRNFADEVTHLLSMREDITERKKLEDQLRQAQKMESLGTLAGGIAHDFNNVLAIINGFAEIAISRGPANETQARHLREIQDAGQRAVGLVKQILTFSRKTETMFKSVSINQHIKDLGRMCAETFPRTISFGFALDETIPEFSADPNQLQQVIMNLCVNARDAMLAQGGGRISVATERVRGSALLRLNADSEREYVCIKVADTGCGMPAHVRARIFEPFFTTKQTSGGTGLGLSVVYGIILNHKGFLEVESVEGKGSTFLIYLPLEAVKPSAAVVAAAGTARRIPKGTETVLVIEDEQALRDLLKALLVPSGYKLLMAPDGVEAVNMLMSEPSTIDAILLDLNLPRMNGLEVYRNIRRLRPDTKVIVISGNITPETRQELIGLGQKDFIPKPYSLEDLAFRLREMLDRKAQSVA
ncbi:hybrid sensor histidine kinase/response regulator [Nibricoccus aquaticus]|nr:PAS domain-containing sensor histidine kinase [Nibricoccus aquaticus]